MKNSAVYLLIAAGILQGCAGTVNPQGKGTRALLEGSKQLSMSSEECPYGIGMVRLYKDTLDGNKTRFNAKMALASKPLEGKFNVYNLLDENNKALLQKGEGEVAKKQRGNLNSKNNSIIIKLSDKPVEDGQGDPSARYALTAEGGVKTKVNEEISIRYNPKAQYYENWGEVENGALSIVDTGEFNKALLQSISVKIGGGFKDFPIPDTIDNDKVALDQMVDATIGTPKELPINAKQSEQAAMMYIQFTNGAKGKDNATYNYITDDATGKETVTIPTGGMNKGEYIMNVFRSSIYKIDADEKSDGVQAFCMEVGTGVMGRASIAEPKKEEAKK